MIILENTKTVDLYELKRDIQFFELDFSVINSLKGDKQLLEKAFQEVKEESI
jgi:hypothetical protein